MGRCRVEEDTDQDVYGDQETLGAEESLQEVHSVHILPVTSHHDSSRVCICRGDTPDDHSRGSETQRLISLACLTARTTSVRSKIFMPNEPCLSAPVPERAEPGYYSCVAASFR